VFIAAFVFCKNWLGRRKQHPGRRPAHHRRHASLCNSSWTPQPIHGRDHYQRIQVAQGHFGPARPSPRDTCSRRSGRV